MRLTINSSKSSSTDLGPNAKKTRVTESLPPERRLSLKMVDVTHSSLRVIETQLSVWKGPHSYSSVSAARLARYSWEAVLGGCCGGLT